MAEWVNLNYGRYLSVEIMNAIYNDFLYISEKLKNRSITPPAVINNSVNYNTNPADILNKFNAVEKNITAFHKLADYPDKYYHYAYIWSSDVHFEDLQRGVKRWIDWLNDAKRHYDGEYATAYLTDKNGKKIIDKNNKQILVYKEW